VPRFDAMSEMRDPGTELSYSQILAFWTPLGLMWLMMAAEQPALSAVIARLAEPELNLAAFGVVWSISLVIESPVIQMLAAATALVNNLQAYRSMMRFMLILAVGLTAVHLLIGLTPLFDLIVTGLMGVPRDIADASRVPFVIMAPFAAAVGYRRLWQGVLIRRGKTWAVPVTMLSRLAVIALGLGLGYTSGKLPGAAVGAIALSAGVVVAAVASGILNRRMALPELRAVTDKTQLRFRTLWRFYSPLALTTLIFLISQPIVTFGIARSTDAVRSLAVFPVVNGFLFLFSSLGLSFQETAIALLKKSPDNFRRLSRFASVLALSVTGIVMAIGLSNAGAWWFRVVGGLGPSLLELSRAPLLIMAPVPALLTYKVWLRARYVVASRTSILARATVAYTIVLLLGAYLGSSLLPIAGAIVAAISVAFAQFVESGILLLRVPRSQTVSAES
jgi:hypothetical protein